MADFDVAIVGQGIAGTLLCYELMQKGKSVCVIDNGFRTSSSMVAAGIMNPITGKQFVLSWKFEALLPKAKQTYTDIERILGIQILYSKKIVRSIDSIQQENLWLSKSSDDYFSKYCDPNFFDAAQLSVFRPKFGYVSISHGHRVDIKRLLPAWRHVLKNLGALIEAEFDYQALEILNDGLAYRDHRFGSIVFCEGSAAITNPFFDASHFALNEGVAIQINVPLLQMDFLYKDDLFFVPYGDNIYWVGGGYGKPHLLTTSDDNDVLKKIKSILQVDFDVLDTATALRPSTRNRRPLLRQSTESKHIFQFNGLGTKGTSLGPYFAAIMADSVISGDVSNYFSELT